MSAADTDPIDRAPQEPPKGGEGGAALNLDDDTPLDGSFCDPTRPEACESCQ